MYTQMISFFPANALLQERLGAGSFEEIPKRPGIYRFYDESGELLYVGKAKNLRSRLFSYKRARAGMVSRKVSQLIGRITSFDYEVTDTEQDALLLENRLIRGERPPFNHANKHTEAYYYSYLKTDKRGLEFRLAMRIHEETDEEFWYGCFKGHGPVRLSLGCLLRMLWMAEYETADPLYLPVQLTRRLTPVHYVMSWSDSSPVKRSSVPEMLRRFMLGESCELLDWFAVHLDFGYVADRSLFGVHHFEHHLECLKLFYDKKLTLHRKLRGSERLIGQGEIDDKIIEAKQISSGG